MRRPLAPTRLPFATVVFAMVVLFSACNQLFVERYQVVSAAHQVSAKDAERLADEIRSAKDRAWWKTADGNDRIDRGVLLLASGEVVRVGFVSHHRSKDHESHTVFEAEVSTLRDGALLLRG